LPAKGHQEGVISRIGKGPSSQIKKKTAFFVRKDGTGRSWTENILRRGGAGSPLRGAGRTRTKKKPKIS